jgi:hypothetical protein
MRISYLSIHLFSSNAQQIDKILYNIIFQKIANISTTNEYDILCNENQRH